MLLGGDVLAALDAWVDERVEPNRGERTGAAGGNVAKQMRDDALREAPWLHLVGERESAKFGDQAPVPADDPPEHALVGDVVEPGLYRRPHRPHTPTSGHSACRWR